MLHTLTGMGNAAVTAAVSYPNAAVTAAVSYPNAAVTAAVSYPGTVTRISHKGQRNRLYSVSMLVCFLQLTFIISVSRWRCRSENWMT